ncbi:MAG: sigma-70 family RNA polymerase sigma factor [Victivallaceae bacterium]|nr:sigma-70 family RNA polymerase sigma factor [Victivallaceae bacterium]
MSTRKSIVETVEPEDDDLVARYLGGEESAFAVLYERYKSRIYSYLGGVLGSSHRSECDDVFQQSWMKVIDKLPEYRPEGYFSAWLYRIARNQAIDLMRRRGRVVLQVNLDDDDQFLQLSAPESTAPAADLELGEVGEAIQMALDQLTPELREVFELRRNEVSFKEIAQIQHCSLNTALGRMRYALAQLKNKLAAYDNGGLRP